MGMLRILLPKEYPQSRMDVSIDRVTGVSTSLLYATEVRQTYVTPVLPIISPIDTERRYRLPGRQAALERPAVTSLLLLQLLFLLSISPRPCYDRSYDACFAAQQTC